MNEAPFRAVGGVVLADHGVIALAKARALARFYAREVAALPATSTAARICILRRDALDRAAREVGLWRGAAGWAEPDAADAADSTHP